MTNIVVDKKKRFAFDYSFSTFTSQQSVYDICLKGMFGKFMEGVNCTIMAYGQVRSVCDVAFAPIRRPATFSPVIMCIVDTRREVESRLH